MSNIVGVMSLKLWFDFIKLVCNVFYSAKDAIPRPSVMSYN